MFHVNQDWLWFYNMKIHLNQRVPYVTGFGSVQVVDRFWQLVVLKTSRGDHERLHGHVCVGLGGGLCLHQVFGLHRRYPTTFGTLEYVTENPFIVLLNFCAPYNCPLVSRNYKLFTLPVKSWSGRRGNRLNQQLFLFQMFIFFTPSWHPSDLLQTCVDVLHLWAVPGECVSPTPTWLGTALWPLTWVTCPQA